MAAKLPYKAISLPRPLERWMRFLPTRILFFERSAASTLIQALALAALFAGFLALVQFASPALAGTDGYYHIKNASLMRTQGLKPDFIWLPLSVLNEREYYNHHFLFHVALMPFTFGDLRLGAKLASITFATLAFLCVWWLFKRQRLPYAALWAAGLMVISEAFIYRMSLVRAQSLSLAVLALAVHWMMSGKHWRLLPLGFFYVWLYNAFPMIVVLAGVYTLAILISERRLELRPLLFAGLGIAAGMLINPYFPDNIVFVIRHLLPKVTDATAVSVGNEWYPYQTATLLSNSPLALVAVISGMLGLGLIGKRMDARTTGSLLLMALFGYMLFQHRRFIEYFPPFALIFAAFAWSPLLADWQARFPLPENWRRNFKPALQAAVPALLLAAILLAGVAITLPAAQAAVADSQPYERYAAAATWLADNTPAGSRVFQTDWDDFTRLFYWNTHNTYLIGLDPTYLQLYDARLYDLWVEISQGDVIDPAVEIADEFGAQYVFSDLNHGDFMRRAADDPGLEEVYRDEFAVIYRVAQ